jgi:YbbR domain-containing protein
MPAIWPFRHVALKLLSLALAILLWMIVAGEETVERGLRVPLQFEQFPENLELLGEPPMQVDVRVRGAAATVGRLSPSDVVAVLDLRASSPGRRLYQLTPEQVRTPFGVQVVQVSPPTIVMVFEKSATGVVPIVPVVEGRPAPGYVLGSITANPKTVEVVGPESAVKQVTEALTETIAVDGADRHVTQSVIIGFLSPSLRLTTPQRASVTVQVLPGPRERTVRGRPVLLRNLRQSLTAQAVPAVVDVILRGRDDLSRIAADQVVAFVDLSGLGVGQYSLTVQSSVQGGDVGVARVSPLLVQVTIANVRD